MAITSGKGHDDHTCPECVPEAEPIAPILLMSVGGLFVFFSLFFGLIAMIGVEGFLIPSVVIFVISITMVIIGYRMNRKNKERRHQIMHVKLENSRCTYCGTQNQPDSRKCDACGAPLKD